MRARTDLGVALVGAGQLDDAITEFRLATETDRTDQEARRLLGLALADRQALGR